MEWMAEGEVVLFRTPVPRTIETNSDGTYFDGEFVAVPPNLVGWRSQ
jgi:hypothetical protein